MERVFLTPDEVAEALHVGRARSTPSARPSAGWMPSSTPTTPRRTDRCCRPLLSPKESHGAHPR
jgi:hypothetical protein